MRRVILAAAVMIGALSAAGAASAQSMTSPRQASIVAGNMNGDINQRRDRFESEMERREREARELANAEAAYGAERLDLAGRVQALIDAGQCEEARTLANEAGERRMALRVRQTCRRR